MASGTPGTAPSALEDVDWGRYDFVDLGCSKGGSLDYCAKRFGADRGIGLDIDSRKVELARSAGHDAVVADVTQLELHDRVRFVSMMDFLEHLPSLATVEAVLEGAARIATDFLFIRHPSFEGEGYLSCLGLRQYWWHWRGHPTHPHVSDYCQIFDRLGLGLYTIRYSGQIQDSLDASVLVDDEPIDQGAFDPSTHSPRPYVEFAQPLWRMQDIFVALRAFDPRGQEWAQITQT
jgi:SAM-dependent methyltransferase